MPKPARGEAKEAGGDLLGQFLQSVEGFVGRVGELAAGAAPKDGEHHALIVATAENLSGQARKVSAFTLESATRLSRPQRAELDQFLRVQDGPAFAERAVRVAQRVVAGGTVGRIIEWIGQHLTELKKILEEILRFIFDMLNIAYPEWLSKLLLILDQFLGLLLSLLGDVFGIDFGRTARAMADAEVNYLNQAEAFERVRAAARGSRRSAPAEDL